MVFKAIREPNVYRQWLPPLLRDRLMEFRESPDFKKRSKQNVLNKTTGPKARTSHTTASISAEKTARQLTKEAKGKRRSASELFMKMHTRKEGDEIVFCDKRSKSVWDEFERLKFGASESRNQATNDELYYQVAGGPNKKGLIYGLGHGSLFYFEKSGDPSRSSPNTFSYTPSAYAQLETRLQKSKEKLQQ